MEPLNSEHTSPDAVAPPPAGVLVSRKRLKLLLMPLLRSAVKKKTEGVEDARLRAWWHLILALGHSRLQHFNQVCIIIALFVRFHNSGYQPV